MEPTGSQTDGNRCEWTGERYVPELQGHIRLEHVHRYLIARELSQGKRVLDIACGEGYGANLLATVAAHVVGVDIAPEVITHAAARYVRPNLEFKAGSCAEIPIPDQSVDVVVSFETLEHHCQHEEMMREIRRVLHPGGLLIISSPDRREYSDLPAHRNPYHVRELYRDEFERLLRSHFRHAVVMGQRISAGSIIGPLDLQAHSTFVSYANTVEPVDRTPGLLAPVYLVAFASDDPPPPAPVGLFDGGGFVWDETHAAAVRELVELRALADAQKTVVDETRADTKGQIQAFQARLLESEQLAARIPQLQEALRRKADEAATLERELRGAVEALRKERDLRTAELRAAEALREEVGRIVEAFRTSHSWRVTAPLRGIAALIRKVTRIPPNRGR
jgi:SAM-dependent methyltransferase